MAKQFKSPGVYTNEIDLSAPAPAEPFGTPAGVVGTAQKGPAFVPVTLASFREFVEVFGNVGSNNFGAYAVQEYLRFAESAVYVRTLGVGDGKQRSSTTGKVTNSGFIVGGGATVETALNHQLDQNRTASSTGTELMTNLDAGGKGRVHFLGHFASSSQAGITYLADAAVQNTIHATPIIRGVLFAASGTRLMLSSSFPRSGSSVPKGDVQAVTGTVRYDTSQFTMVVTGHADSTDYPVNVTASFDTTQKNYFGKVFNRDPLNVRKHGYMLYESFDIPKTLLAITGTAVMETSGSDGDSPDTTYSNIGFIMTGIMGHNAGESGRPNYENYEERYTTATSPFVISQKFGGANQQLFKIEALSDGAWANDKFKISISSLRRSTSDETDFGSFTLQLRNFNDTDEEVEVIEQFNNLNLDLNSPNYVCRRIGDKKVYFDFDQLVDAQKLVVEGEYDNVSKFIRVVPSSKLKNGVVDDSALPVGFSGPKHLVTSASSGVAALQAPAELINSGSGFAPDDQEGLGVSLNRLLQDKLEGAQVPPLIYRESLAVGKGTKKESNNKLYWGVQFDTPGDADELNKKGQRGARPDNKPYVAAWTRFYGNEELASTQAPLTASDTFHNNKFSLENIQVVTRSTADIADEGRLQEWTYKRKANIVDNLTKGTRSFSLTKDLPAQSNVAKFTFFLQGGFDGLNIFDKESVNLDNGMAVKEAAESTLQATGPTIGSFKKSIDVITNVDDVDINLLVTPGMTEPLITDHALEKVEDRFDAFYIMDPHLYDGQVNIVTSSAQSLSVKETIQKHSERGLNSNFGAAYFTDVNILDTTNNTIVQVPPSVAVLGAYAFNDNIAQPWFAPAGFNRGALKSVTGARIEPTLQDRDSLQDVNLNPIATFVNKGAVVFGQRTLQQNASALDRVNVRRLLIEVRRAVRGVANLILFEPNRAATLARFTDLVNPIMERIQAQSGIDRFRVIFDETTTTQSDVDNNIIRGKIFLQPTKAIEVIALDFVITNSGAEF